VLTSPTCSFPSSPHAMAKNSPGVATTTNMMTGMAPRSGVSVFV
jgi:hypothetical protein